MHQQEHNLQLSNLKITNITQRKVAILGGTGSGKTTTLKMLSVCSPVPVYIFDPLNVIRIEGFNRVVFSKGSKEKGKEAAHLFNKVKKGNTIFAFYNMLQDELSQFTNDFFANWRPTDCIIAMDEIHEFVPETGVGGVFAPEVERAVRHWRNTNVGFLETSQRPSLVKKNVLALTDYLIVYRTTWTHDVSAIKELLQNIPGINVNEVIAKLQTKSFLNGYAIDFRPYDT